MQLVISAYAKHTEAQLAARTETDCTQRRLGCKDRGRPTKTPCTEANASPGSPVVWLYPCLLLSWTSGASVPEKSSSPRTKCASAPTAATRGVCQTAAPGAASRGDGLESAHEALGPARGLGAAAARCVPSCARALPALRPCTRFAPAAGESKTPQSAPV